MGQKKESETKIDFEFLQFGIMENLLINFMLDKLMLLIIYMKIKHFHSE